MKSPELESIDVALPPLERRIFCNRTLNLRGTKAVGLDMDYTLVHYDSDAWEGRAYEYAQARLARRGWPVSQLRFEPALSCLGLVIDLARGNVVKANRFGFVRKAAHGTQMLSFEERRKAYDTSPINLGQEHWVPLDTHFSLSEACLFMQLVDLFDQSRLPGVSTYIDLYEAVRGAVDVTHFEGMLKAEVIRSPERFVVLDPELPLALLDLQQAGKKLLLITNSEWSYTNAMMTYAIDRFLPHGRSWRDLFDVICVQARKPSFFSTSQPLFELVDSSRGHFKPCLDGIHAGKVYLGGDAEQVEKSLGISGDEILYIGDHIFADVYASKDQLRWRTGLVLRALEEELLALKGFQPELAQLKAWMAEKEILEHRFSHLRLRVQRSRAGYGQAEDEAGLKLQMAEIRTALVTLDERIAPLAQRASELVNARWGQLMRCGSDKSYLARQIERFSDIYMSRVSNLLAYTPFVYLRGARGSLPHDFSLGAELPL